MRANTYRPHSDHDSCSCPTTDTRESFRDPDAEPRTGSSPRGELGVRAGESSGDGDDSSGALDGERACEEGYDPGGYDNDSRRSSGESNGDGG